VTKNTSWENKGLTGLRIQKVNHRQKHRIEDGPYNPEFPAEILNANRGDLDDGKIGNPVQSQSMNIIHTLHLSFGQGNNIGVVDCFGFNA
jgi:hypothetical protein